ncbi:hypothetical protein BDV24DRAFT_130378 [Aspergillus arachidicola]|uniref:Uncharacterized protein n=1 Tax=Aspergillus arachidicola TaxID=656916 RepID=A0A5N6YD82_9EURO|nr:hypothetical protein BDV24DRAFT_130378 [Aspergillus arachidicola]
MRRTSLVCFGRLSGDLVHPGFGVNFVPRSWWLRLLCALAFCQNGWRESHLWLVAVGVKGGWDSGCLGCLRHELVACC